MKIVVFGSSGKTGLLLVAQALEQGHDVIAYVRKASSITIHHPKLKVVVGTLSETLTMRQVIKGADACISTLGGSSLTKHAHHIINGIDRITHLMESEGVKRFIYLSSLGVGESEKDLPWLLRLLLCKVVLRVPLADHAVNEQCIKSSKLHYTIVRPGGLTDGPKTSIAQCGSGPLVFKGSTSISRANVASFMLQQLASNEFINKSVWVIEQPIEK